MQLFKIHETWIMFGDAGAKRVEFAESYFKRVGETVGLLGVLGVKALKSDRRVTKDMIRAYTVTSLFFNRKEATEFLSSESGKQFANSQLFDQAKRARHIPDIRSPHSNKWRPQEYWKDWDAIQKLHEKRAKTQDVYWIDRFPPEFKVIIRPIIAHLYKEGVIGPRYNTSSHGYAVCLTEPDRKNNPDLYFDWRTGLPYCELPPGIEKPHQVRPLLDTAHEFAAKHEVARFSVLRVWSAPHFWPLMLGPDNRDATSFTDDLGRTWD